MLAATYPQGLLGSPVRSPAGAREGADGGEGTDPRAWGLLVGPSLQASGSGGGRRLRHLQEGLLLQAGPPHHRLHGVRKQAAGQTTSEGQCWPRGPCVLWGGGSGQGERKGVCTVGAAAWLCSLCWGLQARDGRMTHVPARPLQPGQGTEAPLLGVEGQSPGQRSLRTQGPSQHP